MTRLTASDLLRSLDLLVDGPARWGNPVASRRPGVFVVELPGGAESAPIDVVALRRWIERVPEMTLDGEQPTPQLLARNLEEQWLPGEPVLYVGRSARAIGARVAAMYATQLGDDKPYSGGHWLKTLSNLGELRVWWSETDAHEEYEDALLEAIAERADGRLPFANPGARRGTTRDHGLANSLRAAAPEMPAAPAARRRAAATSARSAPRSRSAAATSAGPRRAPAPTYVSRDGLAKLTAELDELRITVRPQVIARVKAARELGDLRENADYDYARKEQSFVEGRIQSLEAMIKTSVIIEDSSAGVSDRVVLGSTVVVEVDGAEERYQLVGPAEASPHAGRISNASPVGRALIGAHAGDEVTVQLPSGQIVYRVREIV